MRDTVCLNGYWDFLPVYENETIEAVLQKAAWIRDTYLVPSSFRSTREMFDIFGYPERWSSAVMGILRRAVTVSYTLGSRVFLRLDAVGQQARIYANDTLVAETIDMFLPVEAELTGLLTPGENTLTIRVEVEGVPTVTRPDGAVKELVPAGTWYADSTMGIWQDVWLVTRPETFLKDPFVLTSFREEAISFTVEQDGPLAGIVTGEVLDKDGNVVLTLPEGETVSWEKPQLWMPDDPYLYTLRMTLRDGKQVIDTLTQTFGFREVWNEKHALYLNGVRVNLRGDAWHYQGLAMQNRAYADNWCAFAKEQGINYIRPHGFPYPQCFYDAADASGMMIMAESAIYGSGKDMQADDPRFIEACAVHLRRFAREYRNHPSVICWSMQNEMRWVEGREGYKNAIPMLMELMAKEDPSGRLVSCDGDNRLLTEEMMQAVSMHYNIDGRVSDWDKEKPLLFGEQGAFHYVVPQGAAAFSGEAAYTNFWTAMESVALREAQFLNYARREEVTGVTPFNYCNYMNKAMPFADTEIEPGDVTAPGPHPSILRAYSLTLNNGKMEGYPPYIPQPALRALRQATAQVTVLPEEMNSRFVAGRTITRSFRVYNDTYRDAKAELTAIAETNSGRVLLAQTLCYEAVAGSNKLVSYELKLPEAMEPYGVALRFALRHGGTLVREETFEYFVSPVVKTPAVTCRVTCLGAPNSVPGWAARDVQYLNDLDALAAAEADLLIIGEDTPYGQAELQPVLEGLTARGQVRGILILRQSEFAPGEITLSKRPFFAAHPTGEHPVLTGICPEDLRFWGPENVEETEENWMIESGFDLPKNPGCRVILECAQGDWGWGGMNWCAMLESESHGVPMLMTQLRLGDFLAEHPAAQKIYRNALAYLAAEKSAAREVLMLSAEALAANGEKALLMGKTVLVTDVTPADGRMLSQLLERPVHVVEAPAYQVQRVLHPLTCGVSNAQLTGLESVTYSAASLVNDTVCRYALEAENVQWLLASCDAPWADLFLEDWQAEPVKISYATRYGNMEHTPRCYGFAARVGAGTLVVLQLRQDGFEKLRRVTETIAMNLGARFEAKLFTTVKQPMNYSVPAYMWLPVETYWNYDEAVAYHADPAFLLNNLGEGSYGWMQRVGAEGGTAVLKDSAGKGVFVTVFMDCALNHNPENRSAEELLPDPSIVPDVTVTTNAAFNLYVNGRKFAGFDCEKETPETIVLTDTLLEKGMNRVFFEILPCSQDVVLGAVFRDKLGSFLTDATYFLTLD